VGALCSLLRQASGGQAGGWFGDWKVLGISTQTKSFAPLRLCASLLSFAFKPNLAPASLKAPRRREHHPTLLFFRRTIKMSRAPAWRRFSSNDNAASSGRAPSAIAGPMGACAPSFAKPLEGRLAAGSAIGKSSGFQPRQSPSRLCASARVSCLSPSNQISRPLRSRRQDAESITRLSSSSAERRRSATRGWRAPVHRRLGEGGSRFFG